MPTRTIQRVDVSVFEPFESRISRSWLRNITSQVLMDVLPGESCQLGVVVADDDSVRRLNREYRGLDEVTDVLSFSTTHQGHWEGEGEAPPTAGDDLSFVLPPGEPRHLGEVFISYPQVVRQAGPGASGVKRELALMLIHGVLHLLGFDHAEPAEEAEMRAKERQLSSTILAEAKAR